MSWMSVLVKKQTKTPWKRK